MDGRKGLGKYKELENETKFEELDDNFDFGKKITHFLMVSKVVS
jgi:hypothetical protein